MRPDLLYIIPVIPLLLPPKIAFPTRFQLILRTNTPVPSGQTIVRKIEKATIKSTGTKPLAAAGKFHNAMIGSIHILNAGNFLHYSVIVALDGRLEQVGVLLEQGNNTLLFGQLMRELTGSKQQ